VQFGTAASQLTDASRVVFSFARDEALPLSRYWKIIHPYTKTPVNAVIAVAFCSALLGALGLNLQAGRKFDPFLSKIIAEN
jgi:amino acid transporter